MIELYIFKWYFLRMIWIALCMAEVWMGFAFVRTLVPQVFDDTKKKQIIKWASIVAAGLLLARGRYIIEPEDRWWILGLVCMCLVPVLLASKQRILVLELAFIYCSTMSLLDNFFMFVTVYLRLFMFQGGGIQWQLLISIGGRVIWLILLIALRNKSRYGDLFERFKGFFAGICVMLGIMMVVYDKYQENFIQGTYRMAGWAIGIAILSFFVMLMLLIIVMQKSSRLQTENEILQIQDETYQKRYQELEWQSEENRSILHDMKNHVLALQGLCENENIEGIAQYLEEMGVMLKKDKQQNWTNHEILDILLGQKKYMAEKEQISFKIKNIGFGEIPLSKDEIVSLFGNLLDNAIEACQRMETGEKSIQVTIKQQENMFHLNIINSIDRVPDSHNKTFFSAKRAGKVQGYGLKNVRKIVENHDGVMAINTEQNQFMVRITFYM